MPAHELRRRIGYVIQQIGLFPHRSVRRNIGVVPELLGWDKARIRARCDELADLVGLDRDLLDRYPAVLSGGQQQRAGVARALAADPPILLMDEPYSAVDPIVRAQLQDDLLTLQATVRKTIVIVTHDIDEAIKLADRVAIMNVGGVLEQYATPDELLGAPANEFVASFLGRERGLRRLALRTVADIAPIAGPAVTPHATPAEALDAMARFGTPWVAVADGEQLFGWIGREAVSECSAPTDRRPPARGLRVAGEPDDAAARGARRDRQRPVADGGRGRPRGCTAGRRHARALSRHDHDRRAGRRAGVVIADERRSIIWWGWVGDHLDDIWQRTVEHVQLTIIAIVVGCVISFALAVLAISLRWTYRPITRMASILYTIPSIALFALLIPFTGLGILTAEIALVSYTILILVGNTVAGLDAVPASVKEAADGMGYTRWRRLFTVEVPLALPTIIAGIRIATVTVIGLVTIAALIGIGGYGALINDGLRRNFPTPIVIGATLSIVLALLVDGGLALVQRVLTPWRRGS